jgi:hypothetical protein
LLLWNDDNLHGPEDPRLGRIRKRSLLLGLVPGSPTFTLRNLPPGVYTVYAGPFFKMAGVRVDVVEDRDVRVDIPWSDPEGVAQGRLFALDARVRLVGGRHTVKDLLERLEKKTSPWLRLRADPAIADEEVTLTSRSSRLWDLLESLHAEKGWMVGLEGEDTLVFKPGP